MKKKLLAIIFILLVAFVRAENGYDLWLRYPPIKNKMLLASYRLALQQISIQGNSATMQVVKQELVKASQSMLGQTPSFTTSTINYSSLVIGKMGASLTAGPLLKNDIKDTGEEGYSIITSIANGKSQIIITGNTDVSLLYGVFHLLRLMQTQKDIHKIHIISTPKLKLRLLDHWDNLNRTVERGYAGSSIWDWHKLPGYIDQRYIDYARANASIGINGTVLNNVNANATILTAPYLVKVKALADVFRPYGIKVYLTARFSSPIEIGGLKTADPLNEEVRLWWKLKAKEIYTIIPDFGGFLVKANSEGQPGPQEYKRTHADGANMLADAVAPYNGIVIWRAFVYAAQNPIDRHKQAYEDFVPLDGQFKNNVMVQVKNGAIDFMPREPFHPLFGAMSKTPLMMEFQITQEYTGQSTSLVYLAPLYKEVLNSDTYSKGNGSTVAKVIDGSLYNHTLNGMAGVANIGSDINWCGHPFAQANWYAFGRLCWDYTQASDTLADEWLRMTFSNEEKFIGTTKNMMLASRETMVNYMNPLGLHHIMGTGHHYGPAPWINDQSRPEWNPVYYHKADSTGIGFDRTATGSNAIAQYFPAAQKQWNEVGSCAEIYLLWFHHVPWGYTMKSGRTLWDELCYKYYKGAADVKKMQQDWDAMESFIDKERFKQVSQLLSIQHEEAVWWRNACLLYFKTFSKMPIPAQYAQPDKTLDYYKGLHFPFAPGNN